MPNRARSFSDEIRVWSVKAGRETASKKLNCTPRSLVVMPSREEVAVATSDGVMMISMSTLVVRSTLEGASGRAFTGIAVYKKGGVIAACCERRTLSTWSAQSGKKLVDYIGHEQTWVYSVAFSPDEKKLISTGIDRTIRVWDIGKSQTAEIRALHTDAVMCASWSGERLFSAGLDKRVAMWSASSGKLESQHLMHARAYCVRSFEQGVIAAGGAPGRDGFLVYWDLKQPAAIRSGTETR
jgi:WD40 repeat protein